MRYLLTAFSIFLLLSGACKKASNEDFQPDMGYAYFPADSGKTWIYHCDSIVFNDFTNRVDTFRFQVLERYTGIFLDNERRENMILERSTRLNDSFPWGAPRIYTVCKTTQQAERMEDNQRFIKLVFPLGDGRKWNGNAMNNQLEQTYVMQQFKKPYTVLGKTFENTITVQQANDSNFIELNIAKEVYAPEAGLIFKQKDYTFNQNGKVSGLKYRLYLLDYSR